MSATQPIGVDSTPAGSENAVRQQLEALSAGEIDHLTFLNNMKERFRFEPDDNWEVLSLLDQYYRRGKITLDVFRALKSGFAEYILSPQGAASNQPRKTPGLRTIVKPTADDLGAGAAPADTAASAPQAMVDTDPTDSPQNFAASARAGSAAGTAATPSRDVEVGDLLRNRYRLDALIAKGAYGTVFEANDPFRLNLPPSGKRVAVKALRLPDPRGIFIKQLRQEFHHLQLLSHPNIVRAFDFDRDGALAFFTMELLTGEHLSAVLHARGAPLQRQHALAIIRDVGAAVAYAHSRGIAHGAINPQNVYITTRGEVRVLGFGVLQEPASTTTVPQFEQPTALADTFKYASCEVLQGGRPDPTDDLFSLSCIAYLLLTGEHPFADRNAIEAQAERIRPPRHSRLRYRQWLTLRAGLQTDARKRPSDVQEWLKGLELAGAATQLPPAKELAAAPASPQRRVWWAIAGLLVAVLLGGGYWLYANLDLFRPSGAPPSPPNVPVTEGAAAPSEPQSAPQSQAPPPPTPAPAPASSAIPPTPVPLRSSKSAVAPSPAPAATAPAAPAHAATKVEMAVDTMDASPADTEVHVTVRRKGNLRGQTSFTWWTESGTAKPGVDFSPVLPHVQVMQDGEASAVLSIPLLPTIHAQPKGFYVGIEEADGGAQIGARSLTQITLPPTN